jgi:hypothetical protein
MTFAILRRSAYNTLDILEPPDPMKIPVGKKYIIEITTPRGLGSNQIVRVYRTLSLFRWRTSSDWFLDREQAEKFARNLAATLAREETNTVVTPPERR